MRLKSVVRKEGRTGEVAAREPLSCEASCLLSAADKNALLKVPILPSTVPEGTPRDATAGEDLESETDNSLPLHLEGTPKASPASTSMPLPPPRAVREHVEGRISADTSGEGGLNRLSRRPLDSLPLLLLLLKSGGPERDKPCGPSCKRDARGEEGADLGCTRMDDEPG
mmetsp:Transcript_10796/g.20901  ORF Transcript_10796/g.20901 Transcript_10796/m.20901 type:complete len:169 (-) Transcript_10796:390-896(-)